MIFKAFCADRYILPELLSDNLATLAEGGFREPYESLFYFVGFINKFYIIERHSITLVSKSGNF